MADDSSEGGGVHWPWPQHLQRFLPLVAPKRLRPGGEETFERQEQGSWGFGFLDQGFLGTYLGSPIWIGT